MKYKLKDLEVLMKALGVSTAADRCTSCGLMGERKPCPKCSRDACDKCVAVDNTDCMFCGPNGDIARKIFAPLHKQNN